jgi:hypothetical protein
MGNIVKVGVRRADFGRAALAVRRGEDPFLAAQPRVDLLEIDLFLAEEIVPELVLDDLPGQGGRAGTGAGVENFQPHLQAEFLGIENTDHGNRVAPPALVVALQRGPARDVVEIDPDQRAVAETLVRVEEGSQQLPQRAGVERPGVETLVQVQVEAGHVNAAHVRIDQVHVGRD